MLPALLLAAALQARPPDVVHARDGRKIEGRLLEYERFFEVEPADPKARPVRLLRHEILKVDLAPNFVRCPEIVGFPYEHLEKTDYRYASLRHVLVCLPQPPGKKVVGIDVVSGRKIWEIDLPNRVGEPVLGGRTIHFMQRDKTVDDTKKVKIAGVAFSKEVHRLTVSAYDLETLEPRWSQTFDNNDRKDFLWEFVPSVLPTLHILPDRVMIRAVKLAFPMDKQGNVDKTNSQKFVTFYTYDPVPKKVLSSVDSFEAAEMGGLPWFTSDAVVTQVYQGSARWRLACVSMKDGKLRWQSEFFTGGKIFDVNEEYAYVSDPTHLYAWSVKNGRKLANWVVESIGGSIPEIDPNHVYLYRTKRPPRAIVAFDVKKGAEAWRIDMPDHDEFTHFLLAGHRLLYTDRANAIHAYDTLEKKPLWKWTPAALQPISSPKVQGSALSFHKDGRVYLLDLATGRKIWEVRGPAWRAILQVGDAGVIGFKLTGADLVHERKLPKGASFFTSTGTPLRWALGEDSWSPPAFAPDALYSLAAGGQLAAIDLKGPDLLWMHKVSAAPVAPLTPPLFHAGRIAFTVAPDMHVHGSDGKTRHFSVRHQPFRTDRPPDLVGGGILTLTGAGLALTQMADGQKVWEIPVRGAQSYLAEGDSAWVLTSQNLQLADLKTGSALQTAPIPRGATSLALEKGRPFIATGPFGFGEAAAETEFRTVFRSKQQDARTLLRFRGAIAAGEGNVYYAHADGEVSCFEGGGEKVAWTFEAREFTSPLLVHGGRVWFAALSRGLYGLNAKTGAVEWKAEPLPDAANFTPILRDGKAAFWSSDGWLIQPE
jgi:outer membrane protein assembly factor BamB